MRQTNETIYFMGIGGTGMASVAGLLKEAGYHVIGSDAGVYPPMSDVLSESGIPYKTPYSPENLENETIDEVVVANVLSRGHAELESAIEKKIKLTSFPAILEDKILPSRIPVVVSGTHGKTTTTTLIAHLLRTLGHDLGYVIGGLPRNFKRGYHLGTDPLFLLEGDEYDTAYFDKESKFLHYRPQYLIFNNLEFDHADIFASLQDIERAFEKLIGLVPDKKNIIANYDDEGVARLVDKLGIKDHVTLTAGFGKKNAEFSVKNFHFNPETHVWQVEVMSPSGLLKLETQLSGPHNMSNLVQALALLNRLVQNGIIARHTNSELAAAVASFSGVARRLDLLGEKNGVVVYEDFAHHPTSVKLVLESLQNMYPDRRIVAAFEPKNATSRRNVFMKDFAKSLSVADLVLIGECPADKRIPDNEKMDTNVLSQWIEKPSEAFEKNEDLLQYALRNCAEGDILVFMSPGSFSGIQHRFLELKSSK